MDGWPSIGMMRIKHMSVREHSDGFSFFVNVRMDALVGAGPRLGVCATAGTDGIGTNIIIYA